MDWVVCSGDFKLHAFQGLSVSLFLLFVAAWYAVTWVEAQHTNRRATGKTMLLFRSLVLYEERSCLFNPIACFGALCMGTTPAVVTVFL